MVWTDPRKAAAGAAAAAAPAPSNAPPPPTAAPASPLPPVGAAPPPQPPAAATTPPPATSGRGRGRGAAAAAQAAAPTAPPPAAAVTPPPQPAAVTAPGGFLALLMPAPGTKHALQIVKEGVRPAGEPNIFPTVYLVGGDNGGMLEPDAMNVEGSNAELPVGRGQGPKGTDPYHAVVIGYRYLLLVWPKAYEKNGPKQVPTARCVIPWNEAEACDVVQDAVQTYSFRDRKHQDQFDAYGHPQLTLELLLFDDHAGLFCVRTTGTYESALSTGDELLATYPDGVPQPVPVTFVPAQKPVQSKTNSWDEHFIQLRQCAVGTEIDQVKAAFKGFLEKNGQDPALTKAIQDWGTFSAPVHVMENMRTVAGMPR
jgi:hypothetical protein